MATNGCSLLNFFCVRETAFYFKVAGTDIEEDAFRKSNCSFNHLIRSNDNKYLILDDEEFRAENLTTAQQCQPECKFSIQVYKDSTLVKKKGRAVMLYVNKYGKKMMVCCNEKHEICPEEMDLPLEIEESAHKAVFYLTEGSKCLLESSLYPSEYLGFETDEDDHTVSKLVLSCKRKDEVDESLQVIFSQYDK